MKVLISYLKSKLKNILVFLLCITIFFSSFALYHLPIEAVAYPCILCLAVIIIYSFFDFMKFKKAHNTLNKIRESTQITDDILPKNSNPIESDYKRLICNIISEQKQIGEQNDKKYSERISYFTLWTHQIKTPIASAKLNLQNSDTKLARIVSSDLFRIEQYVDMALTFLRLDNEYSDYVFTTVNINDLLKKSVKKFSGEFILRGIHLDFIPTDAQITTDEKWLSFIVEQILTNSLKYTPTGGTVKINNTDNNCLCISDTGIGISQADLPRIFENGFTGYNGRKSKNSSGIGLYLCKRICDNLGYKIIVKSEVGKGTSVIIDLSKHKTVFE